MTGLLLAWALVQNVPTDHLRAALHVHSSFSTGKHSVADLARQASRAGIDVLILNDHFMDEITYGVPLFREALAARIRVPSLAPKTMQAYLDAVRAAEVETGILVLPGAELKPHYYWEGSLLSHDLVLRSAGREILVVFPPNPDAGALSQALFNPASPAGRRFSWLLLWPILPASWAVRRIVSPPFEVRRTRHFIAKSPRRSLVAWLVAIPSTTALVLSWPFTVPRWSPYDGNADLAPYQEAVDRAARIGALSFLAHPETKQEFRHSRYPVSYRSDPYPDFVRQVHGVHGFASLYEGYREAGAPGGSWDQALGDFCRGTRPSPTWTVGEIDYHEMGEAGGKVLGEVETVLRAHERSHRAVLKALEEGACYAVRHDTGGRLILDELAVISGTKRARSGERLVGSGPRRIEIRLRREGSSSAPVAVTVIRNGKAVWEKSALVTPGGIELSWSDSASLAGPSYYRVAGKGKYPEMFFSNPVFVLPGEEKS